MSQLTWSALFLAALAAVACCHPEDKPVCDGARPIIGAGACCERHRVAGMAAFRTVAEVEAARRAGSTLPLHRESGRAERIRGDRMREALRGIVGDQRPDEGSLKGG